MLCTLKINPLKLLFVSFQNPILSNTTHQYFMKQKITVSLHFSTVPKSLQICLFFQVKDYSVKTEDFLKHLQKKKIKSPLCTKTVYVTEKLLCISGD